jgi:hypothetical protein
MNDLREKIYSRVIAALIPPATAHLIVRKTDGYCRKNREKELRGLFIHRVNPRHPGQFRLCVQLFNSQGVNCHEK